MGAGLKDRSFQRSGERQREWKPDGFKLWPELPGGGCLWWRRDQSGGACGWREQQQQLGWERMKLGMPAGHPVSEWGRGPGGAQSYTRGDS